MTSKKNLNAFQVKEVLVDNMETNNTNPHASHLRGGANAIQGLERNFKRKRNRIPRTPIGLEKLNKEDSPSEEDTEGIDSESCRIQRRHHTQWKPWNRRKKRGPRVKARHWNSHLFENLNPLWISFLRREQICPCSLHQLP